MNKYNTFTLPIVYSIDFTLHDTEFDQYFSNVPVLYSNVSIDFYIVQVCIVKVCIVNCIIKDILFS